VAHVRVFRQAGANRNVPKIFVTKGKSDTMNNLKMFNKFERDMYTFAGYVF